VKGLSSSACLEKTRRQGGLVALVREMLEEAPPVTVARPPGLLDQEWADLCAEDRLYRVARDRVSPIPRSSVAVVREPGLKARIVTKSEGAAVILGHMARERLFLGLRLDPALADVLSGDPDAAIRRLLPGTGDVLSSDLSRATDLLPLDLVQALVEGLVASGRFREGEVIGLRACSGPQSVSWPSLSTSAVSQRGILMGLPTSWGILCLYHLFILERAMRAEEPWVPSSRGDVNPADGPKWIICGDDALTIGSSTVLDEYDRLLVETGGAPSPGKHWRSRRGRAVFLEELLCFRKEAGPEPHLLHPSKGRRWVDFKVDPAITLRGLACPTAGLHKGAQCTVAPDLQSDLAAGAVVESLLSGGASPRKVWAVQQTLHARALLRLRQAGIQPCLPRCLGGAGFITRRGYEVSINQVASRKHRRALAVLLNRGTAAPGPGAFSRIWRRCSGSSVFAMAEEDAEGLLGRVPHAIRETAPTHPGPRGAPWYDCGPHDEFVEAQTTLAHQRLALVLPEGILQRTRTGPRELARRVKACQAKLLRAWPGVKPWSSGSVGDLLRRHKLLVEATHVWLPGTEDPADPWAPFGVPWAAGDHHRTRLRASCLRALGTPDR